MQHYGHRILEWRVSICLRQRVRLKSPRLRKVEKHLQGLQPPRRGALQRKISGCEVREDDAALARSRHENVQPPLASFAVDWPEIERQLASAVTSVAHRNKNDVAFIALDGFQVF